MADLNPKQSQQVKLRGSPSGGSVDVIYEVTKVSRSTAEVRTPDGSLQNIHKSRIAEIIDIPLVSKEADEISEEKVLVQEHKEEEKMATATATKPTTVKKKENKPTPFDIQEWVVQHGGVHLHKAASFDHTSHQLVSHIAIDVATGFYHTINTYTYPDGTISLGKKGAGGNRYPLKGHQITQPSKDKGGEPRRLKGSKTADELIAEKVKNGYTRE